MLKEFREFLFKGNLMEIAVAFVTGAATAALIDSFIKNVVTPPIGLAGGASFENLFMVLKDGKDPGPYNSLKAASDAGAVTLNWGAFVNQAVTFAILMFVVFMIIKATTKFKKEQPAEPAAPTTSEILLTEIRDALKSRS